MFRAARRRHLADIAHPAGRRGISGDACMMTVDDDARRCMMPLPFVNVSMTPSDGARR